MTTALTKSLILCLLIGACTCKHIWVVDSYPERAEDDLVSVVVLYRHGDRSPIASFPNDPYYNSSYWPEGYGQLLNKGILRQYDLGQWLRNRYDTFLPAEYSEDHIRVYSTDVDRTLMSAEANLAGLYPPPESQTWNTDLLWEPIPVHLMATDDPVLTMNSACPKHNQLQKQLENSDFFRNISMENSELFNTLSNYTGMNVSSVGDVEMIYDVIYVYRNHNESYIPSWVDDIDLETLKYLAGIEFARPTFTEELKRLRVGPFFDYLISHFNDTINNVTDVTKFLMLSAHDSTVSSVLNGMGAFDDQPPEFASTVIWELRRNGKGEYYINVLYKRNGTDAVEEQNVYSCSFDCAFDDFKSNLAPISVNITNWQYECQNSSIQILISWSTLLLVILMQLVA